MQQTDSQEEKVKRLIAVREYLGLNQSNLAKQLGLSQPKLSAIEKGREGKFILNSISSKLKDIFNVSKDWFETGKGEMFLEKFPSENDEVQRKSEEDNLKGIPMYNAPGAGGSVEIYTDSDSAKIVGYLNFPGITKGSFALPVYGNSMYPYLENGVWTVLRPIENKTVIDWGNVYYVEWEDYRMYKRLLQSDILDEVILWSDNQEELINDRPKFSPIHIKKTDIRTLCLVTDIYKKTNN